MCIKNQQLNFNFSRFLIKYFTLQLLDMAKITDGCAFIPQIMAFKELDLLINLLLGSLINNNVSYFVSRAYLVYVK